MTHLYRSFLRLSPGPSRVLLLCGLLAMLSVRPEYALASAQSPGVIELDLKAVSLKMALQEIERQTFYHFVVNESRLRTVTKTVSVNIRTERIEDALDQLLAGTNITYKIRKKQITLIPPAGESHTGLLSIDGASAMITQANGRFIYDVVPDITVTGTVKDETGSPLPGVSIMIKGTNQGTVTDVQGKFTLTVPSDQSILVLSFLGYKPLEVNVDGQTNLTIALTPDSQTLNEVVVVGYGTQEKRDVTGAVSSVKGADIENLPVSSAQQSLQGRTAGVNIVRNGGAPGAGGDIRIRGVGTVNDASPLVVIDGVPTNTGLSDVNPNDIESIEILKDASASAIYGTQAANGVVIITTKHGKYGQGLKVSVSAYSGVSNRIKTIKMLDAPTLAMLKRERYTNDGEAIDPVWEDPQYQTQKTDWQKELLRQGTTNNIDVSISGGNDKSNFSLSTGYYNEKGMIKGYYFKRYSLRLNSDHKLTKRLSIGQNLQITNQLGSNTLDPAATSIYNASAQDGLIWSARRFHPGLPIINPNGTYSTSQISTEFGDINNPIFTVDTQDRGMTHTRILGGVNGTYEIFKGLKAKANIAVDANFDDSRQFEIKVLDQTRTTKQNQLTVRNAKYWNILQEYFLSYDKKFGSHSFTLLAGYSQQTFDKLTSMGQGINFASEAPSQRYMDAAQAYNKEEGTRTYNALQSVFGRLTYSLKDKYLATVTVRDDGSSKFAPSNRRALFPAFSLGWRVSEEPFFAGLTGIIPSLKLTGGYGELGNQKIDDFQYLALVSGGYHYSFGGGNATGSAQSILPNSNVKWERAKMSNFGLEAGLFQNKVQTTINYFNKQTDQMLVRPPVSGTAGSATAPFQNVGRLENKGLEIELGYRGTSGAFTYSISGNVSFIQNKVLQLVEGAFLPSQTYGRTSQEISRTYVGHPIATFYGWRANGLYQNQAEIDNDPNISDKSVEDKAKIKPGDVKFLDLNGDHDVNDKDRTILGSPFPKATYGINANVGYKGIDLTLFFLGVAGVDIYNADRMQGLDPTYHFNMYAETINRWHGEGTSNSIPRMTLTSDNHNYQTSDMFIESGAFFRLKNVTLGYTLPAALTQTLHLSKARFYVTGQNVFVITKYKGMDPELGSIQGNQQINVDYAQYPQARTWTIGAQLSF
jgi:TonB-linked SusC/RagA family outer membrane protein